MRFWKNLFSKAGTQSQSNPDADGETAEFQELIHSSIHALQLQNDGHRDVWGMGKGGRWDFDQEIGDLIFTFPNLIARAPAQIIGSFSTQTGTWLWSWANSSIAEPLTDHARKLKDYGVQRKIRRLTEPKWLAEEVDGWEMTALAARLFGANGGYRGPSSHLYTFFTFGEIALSKPS